MNDGIGRNRSFWITLLVALVTVMQMESVRCGAS